MRLPERRSARLLAVLLSLTLFAAACGDDEEVETGTGGTDAAETEGSEPEGSEPADGEAPAGDVTGEINISGSSTVEPISVAVAEGFEDVQPDVVVNVTGPGTGDGFQAFCGGEVEITDASRAIKEEEAATCEEAGIEFIELKVANDGITVMTNPANDTLECLTTADLYALTGPEAEGFSDWSDAQELATELGSSTELPDVPLDIVGPGEESGTYDAFIELALADTAEARVEEGTITEDEAGTTRPDYQSSPDDNTIIQGVEGSDSSLGWVGFAFAQQAGEGIKELEVDGGDGCVAPTAETIADASYPLSRPLFIYVSTVALDENPAVEAYVDYYLNDGIGAVEEVGYVALPDEDLTASQEAFTSRTTGTQVG